MSCESYQCFYEQLEDISLSDAPIYVSQEKQPTNCSKVNSKDGLTKLNSYFEDNIDKVIDQHDEYWNHQIPSKS